MTLAQLAALDPRRYLSEIKERLRDDPAWLELLDPRLVERTRWGLTQIIASIARQRERIGDTDPEWVRRSSRLSDLARDRLEAMPPTVSSTSSTKEARAWRAFSARLARELAKSDPEALDALKTPYGGLSAAQWLYERGEGK
jgi:hypothetical protein